MNNKGHCFCVGDRVVFAPSDRTKGLYQNIEGFGVAIGEVVTIEEIRSGCYIYCKGGAGGWPFSEWNLVMSKEDLV